MAVITYKKLALRWQPSHREDKAFTLLAVICVVVLLLVGLYLSSVEVPEKPRSERAVVPERVAKFIAQQERPKPKPKPEPPKPKPKPPEPKKEPEEPEEAPDPVKVTRERPEEPKKPLTESEQKARDVAQQSGLLAHMSELQDLVETSDVGDQVKGRINKDGSGAKAAGHSADVLTAGVRQDSGGVDATRYRTEAGSAQLGEEELAAARTALSASEEEFTEEADRGDPEPGRGKMRSEEEVSLVFDRNKSQLQRLYNRARRQDPTLKGKLVLEITILPDGTVSDVTVLSSELADSALVQQMLARIKHFQFERRDVAVATVNYPIEFLPY